MGVKAHMEPCFTVMSGCLVVVCSGKWLGGVGYDVAFT
jgi:hypothetical protein